MYGWHGRLLRIDLTNQVTSVEEIDPQVSKHFIGGRGVAIRYLYDEVDPGVDPLSPQNKLIFATGDVDIYTKIAVTAGFCFALWQGRLHNWSLFHMGDLH